MTTHHYVQVQVHSIDFQEGSGTYKANGKIVLRETNRTIAFTAAFDKGDWEVKFNQEQLKGADQMKDSDFEFGIRSRIKDVLGYLDMPLVRTVTVVTK